MSTVSALVSAVPSSAVKNYEKRISDRVATNLEALSRPLDVSDTIYWGATVHDISPGGIGLKVCYPFKPGTYLAVDLALPDQPPKTVLAHVVHVHDHFSDGTWLVGCEFVRPFSDSEFEGLV